METRNCQNCKKDFSIELDDFSFYEKMKVPPPTFCPECRLQRRLIWMKGLQFFKRKCDLCGKDKLSMYAPDAPYVVYCDRCYWSDNWDARDFGRDYDPSRPFFEQWNELLHQTPLLGLSIDKITGELSPYTNHVGQAKRCYLIYYSEFNEDCGYGFYLTKDKYVYDCSPIIECEHCYDCNNAFRNYNVIGSSHARHSLDSTFLSHCDNCTNCFGSANLKSSSYVFFNERCSEKTYKEKMKEIDLGSYKNYLSWKQKAKEHWQKYPPRPVWDDFCQDTTGNYVFQSKNCKECFEAIACQDSKYILMIKVPSVKDSYDYTDWGENAERIYDSICVGGNARDVRFSHESGFDIFDVEYSKLSTTGSHHFGCVSIGKPEYCILNRQYTREEYEKLKAQIINDMNANPYISVQGHMYRYGEFFPPEFSPHAYNDSFASKFFPIKKDEVLKRGLKWYEPEEKEYAITIKPEDLPDHIKDASETIIKEVIGCATCKRGFKIIAQELQFLKQHNLPLPRRCPFCRIGEKIDVWVQNMKLHDRICDKCGKEFRTHYTKERAPVIYCKECYIREII